MSIRLERVSKLRHRYDITTEHCARAGFCLNLGGCSRRVRVVDISERILNRFPVVVAEVEGSVSPNREWAVPAQVFRQAIKEDPQVVTHVRQQQELLNTSICEVELDKALDELSAVPINITILMETGVAKSVKRLKGQGFSPNIKAKSAELFARWKELHVVDQVREQQQLLDTRTSEVELDKALDQLTTLPINITVLSETGVGRSVKRLKRQSSSPDIKCKSAKLIARWKELVSS